MFPFSPLLVVVGVIWIVFGIVLALNFRGAAERVAAGNRAYRDPIAISGIAHRSYTYKPKTTLGMRRGGVLFAVAGMLFILFSVLISSFPAFWA